jgi:hypothetical protein
LQCRTKTERRGSSSCRCPAGVVAELLIVKQQYKYLGVIVSESVVFSWFLHTSTTHPSQHLIRDTITITPVARMQDSTPAHSRSRVLAVLCCAVLCCAVPLQANHLLPPLRQSPPADSSNSAEANGGAASSSAAAAADVGVDEDTLAHCVGYFLRTCPRLSKVTIGELLGDPDKFFLKVGCGAAAGRCCCDFRMGWRGCDCW